jgi:hypothetical protein
VTARVITPAPPGWWAWFHGPNGLHAQPVAAFIQTQDVDWPAAAIVLGTTGALVAVHHHAVPRIHGRLTGITGPGQPPPAIHTPPSHPQPHPQAEDDVAAAPPVDLDAQEPSCTPDRVGDHMDKERCQ